MQSFKYLIEEFGSHLNIHDLASDEDGYVGLTIDSQDIHLQYDHETDDIVAFTRLGVLGPDNLAGVCLMLLAANQFWQGTAGATFSVEPTSKKIFLADRKALGLVNVQSLNDWLERLLNISLYWVKRLHASQLSANRQAQAPDVSPFLISHIK